MKKLIVVMSCDAIMEGEAGVTAICTEEVAKVRYFYPDNEAYYFEEMEVEDTLTEEDYEEYRDCMGEDYKNKE